MREMSSNKELLAKISEVVAAAVDVGDIEKARLEVFELYPPDISEEERATLLDDAVVYFLGAAVPGREPEGGYISSSMDLKAAVLDELMAMREADFGDADNGPKWDKIISEIRETPEDGFVDGAEVVCPDDRTLFLNRVTCAQALANANK